MATAAPANQLPLLYKALEPLSSSAHANFKSRGADGLPQLAQTHAFPITVDEFVPVQRFYPIIFSAGDVPVPLALMGLNEGVNVFVDEGGKFTGETYIPAYLRRYPFMLARLRPDSEELSLCFDSASGVIGDFEDGQALFDDGKPSEMTNAILKFCEQFEMAAQRTQGFMKELADNDLLIDGELTIQQNDGEGQPFLYRGFKMVSEEKLRELRGDVLRKLNQNGVLALINAHLFSLALTRELFGRQLAQGKGPKQASA